MHFIIIVSSDKALFYSSVTNDPERVWRWYSRAVPIVCPLTACHSLNKKKIRRTQPEVFLSFVGFQVFVLHKFTQKRIRPNDETKWKKKKWDFVPRTNTNSSKIAVIVGPWYASEWRSEQRILYAIGELRLCWYLTTDERHLRDTISTACRAN